MKLTVKDCLQLSTFSTSIIVAGESNLDNRVRKVTVMDSESVVNDAFSAGTMVLTSFVGTISKASVQKAMVNALAKAEASCLVVFQKEKGKNPVSQEIINTANEVGLPTLVLAGGVGYGEVIDEVMEQIISGSSFRNTLVNNTIFHLLDFDKHQSFQEALHDAAIENDFQVILLNEDYTPVFTVETRHQTTVAEAIRRGKQSGMTLSSVYSLLDIDGVLTYWGYVNIGGEKHYLVVVDNEDNYSSDDITKLAEIIELSMGMWRYTPKRDTKIEFLNALLRGNTALAYSLEDEAGVTASDVISVFHATGIDTAVGDRIIEEYAGKGLLEVIKVSEGGITDAVILRGPKLKNETADEKIVCAKFFDELKARNDQGNETVRISHVTGLDGLDGAADGFHLAGETFAHVAKIFPYKRVFTKYELAMVSDCIGIQIQGGQLKKNYMDLLRPFKKEGDHKAYQLLETLETFVLDAGMNSGKTAEFLSIHANTVQYRLKKINEALGAEITGNRVIPGLTVALALSRIERE